MTLEEIKASVDAGKSVHWKSFIYEVIDGGIAGYLIRCIPNQACWRLTRLDGVTMNGKEEDFFTASDAVTTRRKTNESNRQTA